MDAMFSAHPAIARFSSIKRIAPELQRALIPPSRGGNARRDVR